MDLFDVAISCVRRWYVLLPLLAIAFWISYSAYNAAKPVYFGTTVIGFSTPSSRVDSVAVGEPVTRNGLMDFGGASLVANMTALALRQPAVVDQVVADGGSRGYSAGILDVQGSVQQLPLVKIDVTDPDPLKVEKSLESLVVQSGAALLSLQQQAQVPADRLVSAIVVSPPTRPVAGMPTRTRSTVSMAAIGAGIALVVTVLFDLIVRRMTAFRRKGKPDSPTRIAPPDVEADIAGPAKNRSSVAEARSSQPT